MLTLPLQGNNLCMMRSKMKMISKIIVSERFIYVEFSNARNNAGIIYLLYE